MRQEKAFGVIPLKLTEEGWVVFVVQHQAGHWGFPKGHAEVGESPQQAAERELKEETALIVETLISEEPITEYYTLNRSGEPTEKEVHYFLALVTGEPKLQHEEMQAGNWIKLSDVKEQLTFPASKEVCQQVIDILTTSEA